MHGILGGTPVVFAPSICSSEVPLVPVPMGAFSTLPSIPGAMSPSCCDRDSEYCTQQSCSFPPLQPGHLQTPSTAGK